MSGRKRSGAQNRKRKKEAEIAFKKSSVLLAAFLKKAKKEVEAANTSSSESEDGGYQPSVLEHDVDANVENIAVSEKTLFKQIFLYVQKETPKTLKTERPNIVTNLLKVTGKITFLAEKLQIIILITMCNRMWFLMY